MWFKKNKKEEVTENTVKNDDAMSKMIDEVLNEQAEAKEAAMRESAEAANPAAAADAEKSQTIADVIVKFRENQSQETFQAVLTAMFPSNLLLTMTPIEGSENKEEKTMKATPAIVRDPDGNKLLPAFSDKEQIPKEHSEKFSIVSVPFGAVCELTAKIPDCDRIIVNPFTNAFVVNKDIVENTAKAVAAQREKNNQMVEFVTPEDGTEPVVKKVAEWFKGESEIKKAYFTKMKGQDRVSYAFIIDCPDEKVTFPKVIDFLKAEKIALPLTLFQYAKLEKIVNESKHVKRVY